MFLFSEAAGNISDEFIENSKNAGNAIGYVSLGIDTLQMLLNPSTENSEDFINSAIGTINPFVGLGMQLYTIYRRSFQQSNTYNKMDLRSNYKINGGW